MECSLKIDRFVKLNFYTTLASKDLSKVEQTLLTLLEKYDVNDIIDMVRTIPPIRKNSVKSVEELYDFISNPLKVREFLISPKNPSSLDPITTQSKELEIDNPDLIVQNGKRNKIWLSESWGIASLAQNKFVANTLREINTTILRAVSQLKKDETPDIVLNSAIQNYFINNLNFLKDYFIRIGKPDYAKLIEDNMPFETYDTNTKIKTIIREISDYFASYTDQDKMAYADTNSRQYDKAEAFARFLLILPLNFDNFIKSNFNSIGIKNFGKLTNDINKYYIQLGKGRQNATWLDEETVYLISRMVDSVVLAEILSWPIYRKMGGIWTIQKDEYCDTNKVVGTISKLMKLGDLKGIGVLFDPINYTPKTEAFLNEMFDIFGKAFGYDINTKEPVINEIFEKYIEGKNIPQIVRSIPLDSHHLLPIVFYLLNRELDVTGKNLIESELKNNNDIVKIDDNETNIIHSIWRNMFDPFNSDSLFNRTNSDNIFDVYQMISQVFITHERKDLYGIINDMGSVSKKYYSVGKANQRLNYFQSKVNGYYSPLINRPNPGIVNDFDSESPSTTITFKVPYKPDTYTIQIGKDVFKVLKDGKTISDPKQALKDLEPFFEQTIKLDFTSNNKSSLIEIYRNVINGSYDRVLENLCKIAGNFIYANEVSKQFLNSSISDFKNNIRDFYNDTPKLVRGVTYNQIDAFSGKQFALLTKLSLANDIHDGIIGDIVVKGGAGELINSVNLSALATKFMPFFEEKAQPKNSSIKHYSIKDAFKRMTFMRDYVDKTGDVKSATSMNVEEFLINSFIYDFYGDGLAVYLGVLSDKPNIPKMELYRDTPLLVEVGKAPKKLKDCSASDLRKVAVRELGSYYWKMKMEMDRNLEILTKYSPIRKLQLGQGITDNLFKYDLNTDYAETRAYSKAELEKDIHEAIFAAQQAGEDIEINDLLYFSWQGEILHTKPSLIAELAKHDVRVNKLGLHTENSEQFFDRKESELVTNMLQDLRRGVSFVDLQTLKTIDSPAVKAMIKASRYEVNGSAVYGDRKSWTTSSNIIIGKILYGDKFKDLVTKKSLTDWNIYRNLWKYINDANPDVDKTKLDINGDFDMQYFLGVISKLYPKILKHTFTNKKLNELKDKLKTKLNKSNEPIDKNLLIQNYKIWRKENVEETDVEYTRAVINYETETDERIWRNRDTAFKMEGIDEITSLEDIKQINEEYGLGIDTDFLEENYEFSLQVNPEIQRYNTLHYLYSEEGLNSTVGSHINHKAKYNTNLSLLGAIETGQQAKRNVALSGAKNQYTRGDIRGVSKNITIAVVKDVKAGVYTVNGILDSKAITPMDGSTIGNYVFRKEELYSLGSQQAGIENSKPLGNDLNPLTGTGTIIKTAEFALTNGRIRLSERNIILHKHMNNIPWDSSYDGNFLVDYNGEKIRYNPIIVYKPSAGKYYLRTNLSIDNGLVSFNELEINDDVLSTKVTNLTIGELIKSNLDITPYLNIITGLTGLTNFEDKITTSRPIRTNYELWDLFGGAYSASISDIGKLTYENDNTSLENLTIAAHNCGTKLTDGGTRLVENDVDLPLKRAKIDLIVTEGAIKQGASNINSTEMFDNEDYHVTTQTISSGDIGMQLNPEHLVDKSHLTLMTLVVNALGLRGFSVDVANRVYQALATLTDFSLDELFNGIEEYKKSGNNENFKNAVSSLLLKSIIGTSETDGDLLSSIVIQLNKLERNGQDYEIIKHRLPISDPSILNKLISNFSSVMTKAGIRISFPGSMNVLVPSDGIYKIYGGKLRQFATTSRTNGLIANNEAEIELLKLQELQALQPPRLLHEITMGASYFVTLNEGEFDASNPLTIQVLSGKSIKIDDLSSYYNLRDLLKGKNYTLVEDVISGRELAPYNCTFNTNKGSFMLWDMDSIRHSYMIENNPDEIINLLETLSPEEIRSTFHINPNSLDRNDLLNSFKKLIAVRKLIELNSIGTGNENDVYIDGEQVFIDKASLKVTPYELIAPKNYESTFGLQIGDDLSEIANDKYYFLKRILNNYYNISVQSDLYDIILKTVSGKQYPILFNSGSTKIPNGLERIDDSEFYTSLDWDGNVVYRTDSDGNRLYEIPYHIDSNRKIVYDVEILTDKVGNEVIFTKDIKSFISKINYNNIDFGNHIINTPYILDIIGELSGSKDRLLETFYEHYTKDLQSSDGIEDKKALATIKQNNEELLRSKIAEEFNTKDLILLQLRLEVESGNITSTYTGIFSQLINSAIETHTSFLKSLEYIVSRTPAQSHQSFMPMILRAFDESGKNSAYVSRFLLYLLGSDFDVDKASLLGSIIHNGKYIKWSPFMSLISRELLRASETLPFPTGKKLKFVDNLDRRFYDVIDKPINIIWNNDRVTFTIPDYDGEIHLLKNNNGVWITDLNKDIINKISPLSFYILERAIVDKIPEGETFYAPYNMSHLGITSDFIKDSSKYDYLKDYEQFINIFSPIFNLQDNGLYEPNFIVQNEGVIDELRSSKNIRQFAYLLNSLNAFGVIPQTYSSILFDAIRKAADKHNTYFDNKYLDPKNAVINYISSTMFLISSDPVNLVQAMTSVDLQTEVVKKEANQTLLAKQSQHFDKGNIMSMFRLLRLTLSGKQNTGIEASALKVMEAINQYLDVVLNYGDDNTQKGLIKPINIGGFNILMICNAYCKNIANIKSKEVYDALQEIDNIEDLALWLSAFLSLSTDNAKDPTLAKINANPEMIGLYNAGFVLGLPVDFLVNVIMSPSGMALALILQGDVFLGVNGSRNISNILGYIKKGPTLNLNKTNLDIFSKAIEAQFGKIDKDIDRYNLIRTLMPSPYSKLDLFIARRIISLIKQLAYSKGGENIDYDLPTVGETISRELKIKSRRLRNLKNAIEAQKLLIQEKGESKKLVDGLQKLTEQLPSLEQEVRELRDIKTEYSISQTIPNKIGEKYSKYRKYVDDLKSLKDNTGIIRNIELFKDSVKTSQNLKKAISDIEFYLDICEQIQMDEGFEGIDGNHYYSLSVIEELNQFANEMSLLRPILGLNQQLPNSKENQLSFIQKFLNIINDRLSDENLNTKELRELETLNESLGKPKHVVSISDFIWNDEYRNAAIAAYDSIKYKVNILDAIVKVPHYFRYLKTCAAAYESLNMISVQYRELDRIADVILRRDLKIKSNKEIELRLKTASRYISKRMNNMFMFLLNVELSIPKITDGNVDDSVKIPIRLGTDEGNEAFKEWMDTVVIPKYKQLYSYERFFKELNQVTYHKTDNHNTEVNYTTGIDIMSSNPSEITKVAEVTESFNRLQTILIDDMLPLVDAFFYYDLIAYNRQPGQSSLTPIFNKLSALGKTKVLQDYTKFVSDLDTGGNYILTMDSSTIDEIERYIAPVISIYALDDAKEKYYWVKDPEDLKFYLIEKIDKSDNISDESMDEFSIENNEDLQLEFIGELDGIEEEFGKTLTLDSKLNDLGTYEKVSSRLSNFYMSNEELTVLEGQALISPERFTIGNDSAYIENGKLIVPDSLKEKLKKITGLKNVDDLIVSKLMINDSGDTSLIIDVDTTKGNLENPCK